MNRETPTIANYAHTHNTSTIAQMLNAAPVVGQQAYAGAGGSSVSVAASPALLWQQNNFGALRPGLAFDKAAFQQDDDASGEAPQEEGEDMAKTQRRLVQVFIVDPDENVPLGDAIIYRGDQVFTDLTDQELFFDIDIKGALADHNIKRKTIIDKAVTDRTAYLEPARIRDLKMTVTVIATF